MTDEQIIERFILSVSKKYQVPANEIHLRIEPEGFLNIWRYIETGTEKEDQWILLENKKIK